MSEMTKAKGRRKKKKPLVCPSKRLSIKFLPVISSSISLARTEFHDGID